MSTLQEQLTQKIDDIFGFNLTNRSDGISYNFGQYRLNQIYKPLVKHYIQKFSEQLDEVSSANGQSQADKIVTYFLDFFKLYYFQGDFGYFKNKYSSFTYKVPYSFEYTGKDTEFRWASKDCHYVKTSDVVNSMGVDIPNHNLGTSYLKIQLFKKTRSQESDSTKFELAVEVEKVFSTENEDEDKILTGYNIIIYNRDESGAKSSNKKQVLDTIEELGIPRITVEGVVTEFLEKWGRDFFIHKRLKAFLIGELEWYFFQLLKDDVQGRIDVLSVQQKIDEIKVKYADDPEVVNFKIGQIYKEQVGDTPPSIYQIAYVRILNFINILADLEDFKKDLWNKKRKVLKNEFCISLSKILEFTGGIMTETFDAIIKEILSNENQLHEWKEFIDKQHTHLKGLSYNDLLHEIKNKALQKYLYFVVDTKHFAETSVTKRKCLIWGETKLGNADSRLNGILLKSENYQGLKFLDEYKNNIKLAYIDPPFNTGSDFAYKDSYQDGSWHSLISDRVILSSNLLKSDGAIIMHLDHNADYYGRLLLNNVFGKDNFRNEIIRSYRSGGASKKESMPRKHDNALLYSKSEYFNVNTIYERQYLDKGFMGSLQDEQGRFYVDTILRDVIEGIIVRSKDNTVMKEYNTRPVLNVSTEHLGFNTQKPEGYMDCLLDVCGVINDDIIIDFFCGSGSTVVTALKRGNKFIGIELGSHFEDVYYNVDKKEFRQGIKSRFKLAISGYQTGVSKTYEFNGGGFLAYKYLNQYEDRFSVGGYLDSITDQINQLVGLNDVEQVSQILAPIFNLKDKVYQLDDTLSNDQLIEASSMIPKEMK